MDFSKTLNALVSLCIHWNHSFYAGCHQIYKQEEIVGRARFDKNTKGDRYYGHSQ